jgi:hypothetical protein
MEKRSTIVFNCVAAVGTALVFVLMAHFSPQITDIYDTTAAPTQAFPIVAIYAVPLVVGLLAALVAVACRKRWLQKQEPLLIVSGIVIAVIIVGLAALLMYLDGWYSLSNNNLWGMSLSLGAVVVTAISIGVLIDMAQSVRKVRLAEPRETQRPTDYNRMFAMCWLLFGIVMVFIGFGLDLMWGASHLSRDFAHNVLWFGAVFMVTACAGAGLFLLISLLWRRLKVVAIFVALLSLVAASTGFVIYTETIRKTESVWMYYGDAEAVEVYDEVDGNTAATGVCYEEDYEPEYRDWWDEYDSVDDLFADSEHEPDDAVALAAKYAAENIDFSYIGSYSMADFMPWNAEFDFRWKYAPETEGQNEYKTLAIWIFNRYCSIRPFDLFVRYRSDLLSWLPYERYVENGLERQVKLLLLAYDDLGGNDGTKENKFSALYDEMVNGDLDSQYTFIMEQCMSEKAREKFSHGEGEDFYFDTEEVRWTYSFWARRYHECEDGIEEIQRILSFIDSDYWTMSPGPKFAFSI